ncbi:hypothetical protein F5146DRAFT_1001722 [Armillaria mellea]|nr:hypothetical protein F5146DRAFT_1001722 [Armillaria mellea]
MPSNTTIRDTHDGDGESLPRPIADARIEIPDDTGVSQPEQPARTTHFRQKSTRSVFGIQQRGTQIREDKRYEELGPLARTGLFSAVVTTFVVQTSQSLQVDYGQVTATLLLELIDVQRAAANGSLVNNVPRLNLAPFSDFHPTISDSLVNGLWFTSLSFSLAYRFIYCFDKRMDPPVHRRTIRDTLGQRPLGLVLFLAPLQVTIATVVGVIAFIAFAAYFISNSEPPVHTLRDAEHSAVESSADEMDVHALAWLFNMPSSPSVQTIIVQSIGALPLASVRSLKDRAKGILEFYNTVAGTIHSPIEEGRFDRLTCAGFCLDSTRRTFTADMKQELDRLSPEVYAELLAICPRDIFGDYLEIRRLFEAQFLKPADKRLHLQPIVWGYLLQNLLPLDTRTFSGYEPSRIFIS